MTGEIKEILNYIDDRIIPNEKWDKIKDYITNLQQKLQLANDTLDTHNELIEKLQQDLDKANDIIEKDRQFYKYRMDEYAELKKENEKLKECYCNRTDCSGRIKDSKKYDSLKQRIDKAIEEINYWGIDKEHNDNSAMRLALGNILNILIGSDEK